MNPLFSLYSVRYAAVLVYMLQNTEYRVWPYLKWYWRTQNFSTVMHRRTLVPTRAARLLKLALRICMVLQIATGLTLIGLWKWHGFAGGWEFGLALILSYPIVWAHLVVLPLGLGRVLIVKPRERRFIRRSEKIFANHQAVRIAVAGSYGKTSMKELLLTVLSEGKKVAATPANKNVSISHAFFAQKLSGDEDILIIEYGEGKPGDVARFSRLTHPTHAIITGIAPAHLDQYRTLDAAARDIFSVANVVPKGQLYVNGESSDATAYITKDAALYDQQGALGWKVTNIEVMIDGLRFELHKGKRRLVLHSKLLGRHQVGPLALAATLALELGLTEQEVQRGIEQTAPFEHRMQPYEMNGGWIIDDTYNGNIEGIRVGTELLKDLPATRRLYVTPGLVDQGRESKKVHMRMGKLIAGAGPDLVVLMQNSVTPYIQAGLQEAGFSGELRIEKDPLEFYTNLNHFVAGGDVVLMQNDWTDNYQ